MTNPFPGMNRPGTAGTTGANRGGFGAPTGGLARPGFGTNQPSSQTRPATTAQSRPG